MIRQSRKNALIAVLSLSIICAITPVFAQQQVKIVVNNVGYERSGPKKALAMFRSDPSAGPCVPWAAYVVNSQGSVVDSVMQPGCGVAAVRTAQWSADGYSYFFPIDFTHFRQTGDGFRIRVGDAASQPFSVGEKILQTKTGAAQIGFFNGMRNTTYTVDRSLPVFGSGTPEQPQRHNIYGGWWDATGDPGKHLSHLAYSNYLTPQQIPLVVWALLHANETQPDAFGASARAEAAWGADYLLRALSPAGYFYMSVFDNWSNGYRDTPADAQPGTRGEREICAWGTPGGLERNPFDGTFNSPGTRTADYQSAMREGAGVSIAALARAYKAGVSGDSSAAQYLAGAVRAYSHLKENPRLYQDNGRQNIIDYYCGLLAATELYNATGELGYRVDAREWAEKLLGLQSPEGWFYSDYQMGDAPAHVLYRPFYHAAEEGFPVVALTRYYRIISFEAGDGPEIRAAVGKNLRWYRQITYATGGNPFEYVKMYRAASDPLSGGSNGGGAPGDLARGKTATASREEGSYTAGLAFDGSSATRWSSYANGEENNDQWIAVDLGGTYSINRVVLNWEAAHGRRYRIEVSTNRTDWVSVATVTDGTAGRREISFDPVEASRVRMYGVERGLEHGGFSLYDFEVYGAPVNDDPPPPSQYNAYFFIPKVNETGYWWQGENARLASMASAFILGAPLADPTGTMWADTLFNMATAQLDWILGRNPFDLSMMYGFGENNYEDYTFASDFLSNIRGGICNGISSSRGDNENNIEFAPYTGAAGWSAEGGDDLPWRNWRYIEQWLPHNAWYLIAVSSLSYRMDNDIADEIVSVRHGAVARQARLRVISLRGGNVRVEMPFAADERTTIVLYNMMGRRVFSHAVNPGERAVSIRVPARIARGTYVLSVRDVTGRSKIADRINLR